jgi:hypothetical protein
MEATGVYWIPVYEILEARGYGAGRVLPIRCIRLTCFTMLVRAEWRAQRQPTKPLTRDSRNSGSYAIPFAKTISTLSMSRML